MTVRAGARLVLTLAFVSGCSWFGDDTATGPTVTPVTPRGAHKPLSDAAAEKNTLSKAAFSYTATGRRDPFRSYLLDAQARRQAERKDRHIEETESYDLPQYRLTAVLTGTSQPKAMVEDPTGKAYVVRIGARLGRAGGRVVRIDSKGLQVAEESPASSGTAQQALTVLQLPNIDPDEPLPKLGVTP